MLKELLWRMQDCYFSMWLRICPICAICSKIASNCLRDRKRYRKPKLNSCIFERILQFPNTYTKNASLPYSFPILKNQYSFNIIIYLQFGKYELNVIQCMRSRHPTYTASANSLRCLLMENSIRDSSSTNFFSLKFKMRMNCISISVTPDAKLYTTIHTQVGILSAPCKACRHNWKIVLKHEWPNVYQL